MKDNNREQFIRTIRKSLGKSDGGEPADGRIKPILFDSIPDDLEQTMAAYQNRNPDQKQALLDELKTRTSDVQMGMTLVADTVEAAEVISQLVREKTPEWGNKKHVCAWEHPLIKKLDLNNCLAKDDIAITYTHIAQGLDHASERARLRNEIEASFIGITSADFVVTHTATMVMKSRPDQLRAVSLVPCIHICVVKESQLISNLEELYTRLQWEPGHKEEGLTNNMTFISAPSKTGDIELVMVNGAHGPREVFLIVIKD